MLQRSTSKRRAQELGVPDDGVGAEVREAVGLLLGGQSVQLAPTGVERPVPRWSSMSTRKSSSARSSQPGPLGWRVGRGASKPGPPCRKTRNGRSKPVGVGDLAREEA